MLLIPEILDAIDLRVLKLEGVHRPRVSTTRGKKEPPAATTWASWRMSFEASAASAAAPALTAALVMIVGRRLAVTYRHVKKACSPLTKVWMENITWAIVNISRTALLSFDILVVC